MTIPRCREVPIVLLTRKTDYALVALAGLSRAGVTRASARDLARDFHLPLPLLRNILKVLASHGLLVSTRGPNGGYQLARAPRGITLAEIVEAMEGPMELVPCCHPTSTPQDEGCRLEDSCHIKGQVRTVHGRLLRFLEEVTLDQIAGEHDLAVTVSVRTVRFGFEDRDMSKTPKGSTPHVKLH